MEHYFERSIFQRFIYGVILITWLSANILQNSANLAFSGDSSFEIVNLWVFLLPTLIFLIQMILNSYIGWIVSILLYATFASYILIESSTEFISHLSRRHSVGEDSAKTLLITLVFTAVSYVLYRIKPLKAMF